LFSKFLNLPKTPSNFQQMPKLLLLRMAKFLKPRPLLLLLNNLTPEATNLEKISRNQQLIIKTTLGLLWE
jgi:hypothetical protein